MSEVFLSVIIPTRNNAAMLARCLEALNTARRPQEPFEVLIVDNSDPGQVFCMPDAGRAGGLPLRIVRTEPWGLMAARHAGALSAKGQVLSFIDDDALVNSLWLVTLEERFRDRDMVLAGGPIAPVFDKPAPAWVETMWKTCAEGRYLSHLSLLDFGEGERRIDPEWIWGCNYCVRKSAYMDLRGTLPDYMPNHLMLLCGIGESGLSIKIRHSGAQAWYCPSLRVDHCMGGNRLREEYFVTREFILGIEQSYLEIRRQAGLGPAHGVPAHSSRNLPQRVGGAVRRLVKRVVTQVASSRQDVGVAFKRRLAHAFSQGLDIHRQWTSLSPLMMEWIAREDYFDERGKLPVGEDIAVLQMAYRNNLEKLLNGENAS